MNKKIGILTFAYSSNPGSVLQAYALQKTITEIEGYTAFIVNYQKTAADRPIFGKNVFFGPVRSWTAKKVIGWTARCLAYPVRMRKYNKFFGRYYNGDPKKRPCPKEELSKLGESYDAFVVGSDQIWNFDSINVDTTYFLDFVQNGAKKISYAASLGGNGIPQNKIETVAALLKDFSAVSVREKSSIEVVEPFTKVPVKWVLDPSLLLDKEWNEMAVTPREKKYVFLYLREDSAYLEDFAKKLAEKYGLQVIKVVLHWKCDGRGRRQKAMGPLQWLGYMKNADYVVTNSFHGICFSIAHRKEFFVGLLKGNRDFTNPRISDVLAQFGLSDRCIDNVDIENLSPINYEAVDAFLEERKQFSLAYLKNALKGVTDEK